MRFILAFLLIPFAISAQLNKNFVVKSNLQYARLEYCGDGLFGFEQQGKIGYMDVNQKIVIPPTLDLKLTNSESIPSFINGYAAIRINGKYGVIDKAGKTVIPYEFASIWINPLQKNAIRVAKEIDKKTVYGLVNGQNKTLLPIEYATITMDSNLVVISKNGKYGLTDINGKELLPIEYNTLVTYAKSKVARAEKDGKYGFIDLKGNWLFEKPKSVYTLYGCYDNMIKCYVNSKYGYLDMKGNEVIITKYDNAEDFLQYGLARVAKSSAENKYKYLYGYINKKGEEVIPLIYETLSFFKNGFAYAKDPETNRYGYFDKTGKWSIKPVHLYTSYAFDKYGGTWVKMTDNKFHYISNTGKDFGAIDSIGSATHSFENGYTTIADLSYPYALVDQTGKSLKVIDDCDGIYSFAENMAGYKSKKTGLYGFVDISGNKIGNPDFTGFSGFSEGMARIAQNINGKTKHGYINTKGEKAIPVEYETATSFNDGWAVVTKDSAYYYIDKKGAKKEPPRTYHSLSEFKSGYSVGTIKNSNGLNTYYYINPSLQEAFTIEAKAAYAFWEDVAVINRDTVYELINKKGESIKVLNGINFLKFANEGKLAVREGKKWGYIDTKGNTVISPQYDSCDSFKGDYAKVMLDGKWGIIDKTGKTIIKPDYKNITPGENGIFIFYDTNWGIMDKTGKTIAADNFSTITPFVNNRALARFGKSYTILKSPLLK